MEIIHFTWEEFDKSVEHIASNIESVITPNIIKHIYGIPRGGLILAVALSHRLDIPLTMNYDKYPVYETLVVDDISDSGKTLSLLNPILSATIHIVKDTLFNPMIYYTEKPKGDWIIYPWEVRSI